MLKWLPSQLSSWTLASKVSSDATWAWTTTPRVVNHIKYWAWWIRTWLWLAFIMPFLWKGNQRRESTTMTMTLTTTTPNVYDPWVEMWVRSPLNHASLSCYGLSNCDPVILRTKGLVDPSRGGANRRSKCPAWLRPLEIVHLLIEAVACRRRHSIFHARAVGKT